MYCEFCDKSRFQDQIILENETCYFIDSKNYVPEGVLVGSGLILPKEHRKDVFELNPEEFVDTLDLLVKVKKYLEDKYSPDGFNLGWNVGRTGGQEIFHAHMHVMPRYKDEPLAGTGIRYIFKQESNRRRSFQK